MIGQVDTLVVQILLHVFKGLRGHESRLCDIFGIDHVVALIREEHVSHIGSRSHEDIKPPGAVTYINETPIIQSTFVLNGCPHTGTCPLHNGSDCVVAHGTIRPRENVPCFQSVYVIGIIK